MSVISFKSKILKYFIIVVVSIIFAVGFVNIFISANKMKVVINYITTKESGIIQLFYKQGDQTFSEERSIIGTTDEDGRTVFEIPRTDVDGLRIDTDGISIFRIKSIEITKLGYNQLINSENWSDYYRAQYDMDGLFDDESLISYAATGIDPYIILGLGEASSSIKGYLQYYFLVCISSVFCFFAICFMIKYIKKKGIKKENFYIFIKYVCAVLVLIQVVRVDFGIVKNINERKEIEYMVYIGGAESVQVPENLTCKFIVHGKELLTQQFMIETLENVCGSIKYQIADQEGNIVIDSVETLESALRNFNENWDAIIINCENLDLKFGQEYEICMKIESDVPVNVIMNNSGEIQQRQTMRFVYGGLYISVVMIVSLALLIMIFWICLRDFNSKVFLTSAIILGTISCFVLTPCTADDEYRHFLRVYDIVSADTEAYNSFDCSEARGNVILESQGAPLIEVPYELSRLRMIDMHFNYDNISYDAEMNYQACPDEVTRLLFYPKSGESGVVSIVATKTASIWAYIPQVVLAFIGKCLGMNAVGVYYMARIGNMLFAIFVVYICMRMLPDYKNIFMLLYFVPNAFWISASCSRDSVVTSLSMLCIAYIIYLKENKKIFDFKRIVLLTVLFSILAIIKLPYALLASLLLLLESDNYPYITGKWRRWFAKVGIAAIVFVVSVGSYKIDASMESIKKMFKADTQVENSVWNDESNEEQRVTHVSYALEHPREIMDVIWNRYKIILAWDIPVSFNGYRYQFGNLYIYMAFAVMLLSKKMLSIGKRLYAVMVYMAVWLSIIVVGYTLTPPDYGSIWGINPRYMIPILSVWPMAISSGNDRTNKVVSVAAPIVILGMAAMNIISLIPQYY